MLCIMNFKNLIKDKRLWIALGILLFGIFLNQITSRYIYENYKNLPILNDFILDNIPYFNLVWLFDLFSIISLTLFSFYCLRLDERKIPLIILVFGLSQILRGSFIILTPFGIPKIDIVGLFKGTMFRSGVYPSGHTGTAFLCYLFSDGKWKKIFLILTIFIMATLLLGRGHYSIDIFSALFFNYAIYCYIKNKGIFTQQK